jgi:ADP-ribose diphosphatase
MATTTKPLADQLGWKLMRTTYLFNSQWYDVRQDELSVADKGTRTFTYTYIEHPGSVFVVPLTADQRIILIRSYRYTLDAWCWEVPAGTLGDHTGSSPEAAALRELQEEVGATCYALKDLGNFYLGNGFSNHRGHFFLAVDVHISTDAKPDAFEQIAEIALFSLDDIERLIREGAITDGDSAFALLLALNRLTSETRQS